MELKNKIIIGVVYTVAVAGTAVYIMPTKTKIETKTVSVDKVVYKDKIVKDERLHKHITITKTQDTDGKIVTKTDITYDYKEDDSKTDDVAKNDTVTTDTTKEVTRAAPKVTLSMLGGWDLSRGLPVYGVSLTKPIFGPFTIGAFGLNNGSVGLSFGFTF